MTFGFDGLRHMCAQGWFSLPDLGRVRKGFGLSSLAAKPDVVWMGAREGVGEKASGQGCRGTEEGNPNHIPHCPPWTVDCGPWAEDRGPCGHGAVAACLVVCVGGRYRS